MAAFAIQKQIQIAAPAERVFAALTDSAEIPRYFPLQSVESDWQEGSAVLYKGEVNGNPFTDFGVIETLAAPTEYRYRYWSDNHGTENTPENQITIRYRLAQTAGGTLLEVIQSNIGSAELFELMNSRVWDYLLASLKKYVEERH